MCRSASHCKAVPVRITSRALLPGDTTTVRLKALKL